MAERQEEREKKREKILDEFKNAAKIRSDRAMECRKKHEDALEKLNAR